MEKLPKLDEASKCGCLSINPEVVALSAPYGLVVHFRCAVCLGWLGYIGKDNLRDEFKQAFANWMEDAKVAAI